MTYEQNYSAHHGIKGQKWGQRRFQNEDGSLTPEGQERYDNKKDRGDKGLVRKTIGSEMGNYAFAKWRARRHQKNLEKAQNSKGRHAKAIRDLDEVINSEDKNVRKAFTDQDRAKLKEQRDKMQAKDDAARQKKIEKYQSKKDAQEAANRNLDAYRRHTKKSTLVAQNLLITAPAFRHARARGEGVLSSIVESSTPVGPILRMMRDKKVYGKYLVFGDMDDGDHFAVQLYDR